MAESTLYWSVRGAGLQVFDQALVRRCRGIAQRQHAGHGNGQRSEQQEDGLDRFRHDDQVLSPPSTV